MGLWVFAIGAAAFMLLLTAFFAAVLARAGNRLLYWIPMVLWWLVASGFWCTIAAQAWVSVHRQLTYPSYFPQALFLALIAVLMIPAFARRAWMRNAGRPDAASWPRLQLAGSCLMLLVVSALTIIEIDRAALSLAFTARPQIQSAYQRLLGPDSAAMDNAAELYRQAFALCRQTLEAAGIQQSASTEPAAMSQVAAEPGFSYQLLGNPASAESPQLVDLVGKLQPAVNLARQAAIRPVCRMEKTISVPAISQPAPYLAEFAGLASAVYSDALVAARDGRAADALADLMTLRRMEQHVQQSKRSMLSLAMGLRIGSMANEAIAEVLPAMTSVPEHMEMLVREDAVAQADLLAGLQGEELGITAILLDAAEGKVDLARALGQIGSAPTGPVYRILYLRSDLEGVARYFAQGREAIERHGDWPDLRQAPLSMTAKAVDSAVMPIVTRTCPRYLATSRCASLCIALTRYRLAKGKYPVALDELVPEYIAAIPADPFDSKPIRYRLEKEEATVYSVGENRKDDGGQIHSPAGTSTSPEDVGLELKPPRKPPSAQ